jgi:hypothetical protein
MSPWKCRSCQNGSPLFIDWLLLLIALPPPTLATWFDLYFLSPFTSLVLAPGLSSQLTIASFFLFFSLLFKIVAIAHPFQNSQNSTRYSYVWTIVQTGTHSSHDGSLGLLGILDKLLPDRFFFSLRWPHIHFFFRLHQCFFPSILWCCWSGDYP